MTKPTKWGVRPAKTQISLGIRPVWSESSLCALWEAKDPSFFHADSEDWSDSADAQAGLSLRWTHGFCHALAHMFLGPVVQSVVSLTSSLRVISLTVLADSIHNILIFFAEKMWVAFSYSHFFSKRFQHICVPLDVNFNESLTNDVVSFEQLGPGTY